MFWKIATESSSNATILWNKGDCPCHRDLWLWLRGLTPASKWRSCFLSLYLPSLQDLLGGDAYLLVPGISKCLTPILHELFLPDASRWARRGVYFQSMGGWQFASCLFAFLSFFQHCTIGIIFQCTKLWNSEAFTEGELQWVPLVLGNKNPRIVTCP